MNDQNHHEPDAASDLTEPEHYLTVEEAKERLRQIAVEYPEFAESAQGWIMLIENQANYSFWDALPAAKKHVHLQHPIQLALEGAISNRRQIEEEAEEQRRRDARSAKRRARKLADARPLPPS